MRQKIFCYIPEVCLVDAPDISSQVRSMLTKALAAGLSPAPLPRSVQHSVVDMSAEHMQAIEPLAKSLKLAPGRVVGGLLFAHHLGTTNVTRSDVETRGLRTGQITCLEEAAPLLKAGKIVFSEAGTGSGKSRLIAHAAAYALRLRNEKSVPSVKALGISTGLPDFLVEHAERAQDVRQTRLGKAENPMGAVIVCAPSIENIVHLLKEWQAVRKTLDPKGLINYRVVLGRGQFVSPSKLALLLGELAEPVPAIEKWIKSGMRSTFTESSRVLSNAAPNICGLMADLEFLCQATGLNAQDAALDEDSPEDEMQCYLKLRKDAMDADLVVTSTAMVAMDNMLLTNADKTNLLPYPVALFVDEAHTLEGIQASIAAKSLSFLRLQAEIRSSDWKSLRKDTSAINALLAIKNAAKALGEIPDGTLLPIVRNSDPHVISGWHAAQPALQELEHALQGLVAGQGSPTRAKKTTAPLSAIRYIQKSLQTLESIKAGWKGHLTQSPRRQQIGFVVGPTSIQKYLLARWVTTPMAMLLSGTLAHIGVAGATFAPIKAEMGVPPDRDASTTPLHPSWIYSTPTVFMPSPDIFHEFMPPTGFDVDEDAMNLWFRRCAKTIAHAASSAAGGTMVLTTSFDRLEGIANAFRTKHPELSHRLVVQDRYQRLSQSAEQFRTLGAAGHKPVWIATGAAWTGLDLTDKSIPDNRADEDMLLTDLIIPNLPFGLDRTSTHMARMNRIGFGAEVVGVQRRLRQGLGRLVRRDELLNRRIWILDGRLMHPSAQTFTADLSRVLKLYLHHATFS